MASKSRQAPLPDHTVAGSFKHALSQVSSRGVDFRKMQPIGPGTPNYGADNQSIPDMSTLLLFTPIIAAAGKAFIIWLCGGSFGLAVFAFFIFKAMGK